jgi:rsbT antagonist protein RsbS
VKELQIDSETAMSVVRNCLVVTIQSELNDDLLLRIRTDILQKVQATQVGGLILDFSTVRAMDTFAFNSFTDTAKMASLLGVSIVFVGLQPGVVSALVDLGVEIADVDTALTIEDAFEQLQNVSFIQDEPEDAEDTDNGIIVDNEWESDRGEEREPAGEIR